MYSNPNAISHSIPPYTLIPIKSRLHGSQTWVVSDRAFLLPLILYIDVKDFRYMYVIHNAKSVHTDISPLAKINFKIRNILTNL